MDRRGNETEAGYRDQFEITTPGGNPSAGYLRVYAKSDDALYTKTSAGVETKIGTGTGGVDDPVQAKFGAPNTAYEFDTATVPGSAIGTATIEDTNTTVPSAYYLKINAAAGTNLVGRAVAAPASPFTGILKVCSARFLLSAEQVNFTKPAFFGICESVSGKVEVIELAWGGSSWTLSHDVFTNPTTYSSTITNINAPYQFPLWLGFRVNSSTSVDSYLSYDGRIWRALVTGRNPGFSGINNMCFGSSPENASYYTASAFEFVRIWNSALTFPA